MNELRVRTSLGRDMDCRVVWSDPKAKHFPHIVVEDEHGRCVECKEDHAKETT